MKIFITILILFSTIFSLNGCANIGSMKKTNQLEPGMTTSQVKGILGNPGSTEFKGNKWIWKYSLHKPWVGFVPHYLVFGKKSKFLEAWFADQNEYFRQQSLWLQAYPSTQKHEIDLNIKND